MDFWFCSKALQFELFEKQICQLKKHAVKQIHARRNLQKSMGLFMSNLTQLTMLEYREIASEKSPLRQLYHTMESTQMQNEADTKVLRISKDYLKMMKSVKHALKDRKEALEATQNLSDTDSLAEVSKILLMEKTSNIFYDE